MKFASIILLLLIIRANASMFDAIKGAMSSVENSFGKLLNDVVSDVKSTVHCTILAMEQVLAMNGVGSEPTSNKECYGDEININVDIDTKKRDRNSDTDNNIAQHIHASISKVNESLSHILDNTGHERIEKLKKELKHESNRLTEVSLLLRKELEKISRKVKNKFPNVDIDSDFTTLESVRNNMKILYEVEKTDKNASEEIGQVLNEAINVLHINATSEIKSDEEKINVIMKELEQESTDENVSDKLFVQGSLPSNEELKGLPNKLGYDLMPVNTRMNVEKAMNVGDIVKGTIKNAKNVATEVFTHSEQTDKKASGEIGQVLNEALDVLRNKTTSEIKSDEEKIEVITKELEQESTDNNVSNKKIDEETSQSNGELPVLLRKLGHNFMPGNTRMNVEKATLKTMNVGDIAKETIKNVATEDFTHNDKTDKKVSEEIGQVLNEALDVLRNNTTSKIKSYKENLGVILKELKQESTDNTVSSRKFEQQSSEPNGELPALPNKLRYNLTPINTRTNVEKATIKAMNVGDVAKEAINDVQDATSQALTHNENTGKNPSEEIHHELNEALNVLRINTTSEIKSHEDKLDVFMNELKHESTDNTVSTRKFDQQSSQPNGELPALPNKLRYNLMPVNTRMDVEKATIKAMNVGDVAKAAINDVQDVASKAFTHNESTGKNPSEEIHHVLNEALNVLRINTTSEIESHEDKLDVIMKEVKKESTDNTVSNKKFDQQSSQPNGEFPALSNKLASNLMPVNTHINVKKDAIMTMNDGNTAKESITNVEDVATEALKHNEKVLKEVSDILNDETSSIVSRSSSVKTFNNNDVTSKKTKEDNLSSFNFGETKLSSQDEMKGIEDAMSIFNEGAQTQKLLDDFFAKEHGIDAFANPNLLNFE